jgi:hypothetical protein
MKLAEKPGDLVGLFLPGASARNNEVGQVIAKTEATVGKIGGKFPPGGGSATEAVTTEGVTVTVPKPKATLDELTTDPMAARNAEFPTKFHKRSVSEVAKLRAEFESVHKPAFIKQYAQSVEAKQLFTPEQIKKMELQGKLPENWVVHHKMPLFRGGTNDFSNFQVMTRAEHQRLNTELHWYENGSNPYGLD